MKNAFGWDQKVGSTPYISKRTAKFEFDNWYVPKELDTEAFNLVESSEKQALFEREMKLVNYTGATFELKVQRNIKLLDKEEASGILGLPIPETVNMVGFSSENSLTNLGQESWDKKSGLTVYMDFEHVQFLGPNHYNCSF